MDTIKRRRANKLKSKKRVSRAERRQKEREEQQEQWVQKMKKRGGFAPKKAKHWGDSCAHTECEMWGDGECQYRERDTKGCYLDLSKDKGKKNLELLESPE